MPPPGLPPPGDWRSPEERLLTALAPEEREDNSPDESEDLAVQEGAIVTDELEGVIDEFFSCPSDGYDEASGEAGCEFYPIYTPALSDASDDEREGAIDQPELREKEGELADAHEETAYYAQEEELEDAHAEREPHEKEGDAEDARDEPAFYAQDDEPEGAIDAEAGAEEEDGDMDMAELCSDVPLWRRVPMSAPTSAYERLFYSMTTAEGERPLVWRHFQHDELTHCTLLGVVFIPDRVRMPRPVDLYQGARFTTTVTDILPEWLRFVTGVVDLEVQSGVGECAPNAAFFHDIQEALMQECMTLLMDSARGPSYWRIDQLYGVHLRRGVQEELQWTEQDSSDEEELIGNATVAATARGVSVASTCLPFVSAQRWPTRRKR